MKKIIFFITILFQVIVLAQVPANYFDSAVSLTGYSLKTELRDIIAGSHQPHSYSQLYDSYQTTFVDNYYENDGTLLDMYSEKPNGVDAYNYTHNANHCGNYSSEGDCFNREHVMPQSVFGSSSPMQSDAISVVPSDGKVNGQRGSLAFGEVGSANWTSTNGSKRGSSLVSGYTGNVFEPIDEFKGDIARIMFYFATRYENQVGSWNHDMLNGTSDQVYADWFLDLMIQWHHQDPVSQSEIDRNDAVYDFQNNANPFINHPEWVNAIWNPVPDVQDPTVPTNLVASNETFNSIDLTWTASTDDVSVIAYDIYRDGFFVNSSLGSVTSYTDYGFLMPLTTYSYYVIARDGAQNTSTNSNTVTATTLGGPIFSENFDDCASVAVNFTTYNEASNKDWNCTTQFGENDTGAMQMNGYQENIASKDWLITTNAIDFSQYTNEKLSFYLVHTYGTMSMDLVYSTDYDGTSNPATFTWTSMPNVAIDTHDGTFVEIIQVITEADISVLTQDAYVAFKYYSNGSPTRFTVDSFVITGDAVVGVNDNLFTSLVIYPNPVTDILNIKSNGEIQEIAIYNNLGQLILSTTDQNKIDISNLNGGVYFCKVSSKDGNTIIKKIIKK